jgi:uncharacterized protein (TIRG00374 family)
MLETSSNSSASSRAGVLRARVKWLLRFSIGAALIGVLWKWQGAGAREAFAKISPPILLGLVLCYLCTQAFSAAKWQLLLNAGLSARTNTSDNLSASGAVNRLSWFECVRLYFVGIFWNLWMPTSVGGDAMRAYLAGRRCGDYSLAATSIFLERLTGFLALLAIGACGLGWQILRGTRDSSDAQSSALAPALSTLMVGLGFTLAFFAVFFLARRSSHNWRANADDASDEASAPPGIRRKLLRIWLKVHDALELYLQPQTRGALIGALAMSLVFQGLQVVLNYGLARAVGLDLPFGALVWIVPSLSIASMLPLGIGGLGVREAAALGIVRGVLPHAAPGTIIAWSLCWQATLWLAALPGGVLHFLKREEENDEEKTVPD